METEIGRAIDALQTDQRLKQSNVFLEYNKVEIVAERTAEAFVTIGKWAGFCGEGVASALVPGDECVADVHDGHLNPPSTVLFHEVFCGGEELAAQLSLLLIGADGKESQIPDATLLWIEQNGSKQRTVWFVAVGEKVGPGLVGEFFAEEGFVEALSFDENSFGVPTRVGAVATKGVIDQVDDCGVFGFDCGIEVHRG